MGRVWWAIAKAEFLVRTSKLHRSRKILYPLVIGLALAFGIFLIPTILGYFFSRAGAVFEIMLATSFPGLLRTIMMVLWMFILIVPISNSLENVKIGQWEILFSNNVKTRDLLFGTFVGRIPVYGIIVIALGPIAVSPFVYAYNVSIIGQLLMYLVIFLFAIVTIWLSTVFSTAIHAKIGSSPRGDDIGKALSWALAPLVAIPAMGSMYWMNSIVSLLNLNVSMILPSTWSADILTWIAMYTGSLRPSSILNLELYWFAVSPIVDMVLLGIFSILVLVLGFKSADRLFAYGASPGSQKVARAGPEGFFIRGVRKVFGRSFGTIVVTSFKDFTRKLQNIAKVSYGLFLGILVPLLIGFGPFATIVDDPVFVPVMTSLMIGMMLGIFSGFIFGGVGLLDSRDQLWILKSTPRGVPKFIVARVLSYMIVGIPYALIPAIFSGILLSFPLADILIVCGFVYSIVLGGIFVGVGITSINPSYEDTSSGAFVINQISTIVVMIICLIVSIIPGVLIAIRQGLFGYAMIISSIPTPIIGLVILMIGMIRLNVMEVA
ncbi:MAG: hypothetical protein AM325_009590 [Candidatus Thorarchaeota archaeon SMTZ1-45]|nr:MAG: hypothetical protein AM325_10970 [Candidatus Thorarchaeota archaeon SMTZ1-45]